MPSLARVLFISLIISVFTLPSCGEKARDPKPLPADVQAYVYAYTEGLISRTSSVRIQFAGQVAEEDQLGQAPAKGIVAFSPQAPGEWQWLDRQTLVFTPKPALAAGEQYLVTVQLDQLFDNLPEGARSFEFGLQTREPHLALRLDGLETPDFDQREVQVLKGSLHTSDYIASEEVQELLSIKQAGRGLNLTWSHEQNNTIHYFTAKGVSRGNKPATLSVSWNGKAIRADQHGEQSVEVPALGDFKVTQATAYGGSEARIEVRFSDPLDPQQDFTGKVSLTNSDNSFRYVADGAMLNVFPNRPVSGDQRLTIHTGLRNRYGDRTEKNSLWDINFTAQQPQLRLVGNGNILPGSSDLLFPFEAIGLEAVEVEIFKIYNNNILQFLQYNKLDGNNEMHRVGKVEARATVPLTGLNPNATQQQWERYALDLRQFFDVDAKAIYQVRIGFQRKHSLFGCSDGLDFNFQGDEPEDLMQGWYGLEGYYDDYEWEHREDPCYPGYYNSDRFVQRNVLASNMGIIVKGNEDQAYTVAVTDLRTTAPMIGANLQFYNFQQQLLGEVSTDGDGLARIQLDEAAYFVVGEAVGDQAYLRLEEGEALSLSRYDVAGMTTQDGLKGFFYGERGVWRPGDSVFLNFILEDKQSTLPVNYPIQLELRDAQGQVRLERSGIVPTGAIYPLHFTTKADDKTGIWYAKVRAGGATFTRALRIETVKPNRLKVDPDLGPEPRLATNGSLPASLQSSWLHGAPAANLKAQVEAEYRVQDPDFDGFKGFRFIDRENGWRSSNNVVFDGTLDGEGKTDFTIKLPDQSQGLVDVRLRTRVFEKGGDFSTDNQSFIVYPVDQYVGVRVPRNRYDVARLTIDEPAQVELAAVNWKGKAQGQRDLKVEIFRLDWRWWWDDVGGGSQYYRNRSLQLIGQGKVRTNAEGKASWEVEVEDWGRYLIRVCDAATGYCASDYVYAGSPWYNEQNYSEEASMLQFQADRESYGVGDDMKITFPAGAGGRALLSLENGNGVLEERWLEVNAGDNTVSIKATEAMSPTVYAHIMVIQPHGQQDNDLPIRAYGVIPLLVENPATVLEPELKMAKELRPREKFTVEVSEREGREMTYTLAVVDEGLLSLTRFNTPDPHDAFYAREALGVRTWDVYRYVVGAHGTELNQILSIGGDGESLRPRDADRANRFEPVVRHLGPFKLKPKGKAQHTITMPNYVGAVRAMVVAADTRGAYGKTEQRVPVRQPLMVMATLPRVLGVGERLELPVNIFAMKDGLGEVTVSVKEESGLVRLAQSQQRLSFGRSGDKIVRFPLELNNREGIARFTITARAGSETATQEIAIDVRNPNPVQTQVERLALAPGESRTLDYQPLGVSDRSAVLEVANLPALDLERRLDHLLRYPYGCLEQTTSAAFPQIHLARFLELSPEQEQRTRENVEGALQKLSRFQLSDGGFAYWPGNSEASQWATSYAGHFMLAAKAAGFTVPAGMLTRWSSYQRALAQQWDASYQRLSYTSKARYYLDQAYRLYTLALANEAELGAMNRLREVADLDNVSSWRLAAAYALAGRQQAANELAAQAKTTVENYRELGWTYGSALRDRAMVLEALVLMKKQDAADRVAQLIAQDMSANRWLSTQEIAYSLLAFSQYIGDDEKWKGDYTFTMQESGKSAVDAGTSKPYMQIELSDRPGTVRLKNTSKQRLYVSLIRRGKPLPADELASSSLLDLNLSFRDANGNELDVRQLKQGTDFVAEVQVKHTSEVSYAYQEMALEQIFPSGWEITNTRFEGLTTAQEAPYEYRDYRDDRVHTFFDLGTNKSHLYRVYLTATYAGHYYLPATQCGAMYDNKIAANTQGYWVDVEAVGEGATQ